MCQNPQETADLVTFTGEIFNVKLRFLCSDKYKLISKMAWLQLAILTINIDVMWQQRDYLHMTAD